MKIQKFNESVQNWSEEKISKMYDDKYEFSELILGYVAERGDISEKNVLDYYLDDFWFEEGGEENEEDTYFNASFTYVDRKITYFEFTKKEFEDLILYMNDPQLYTSSKKYNL
jgi:hypothetical protein